LIGLVDRYLDKRLVGTPKAAQTQSRRERSPQNT
jgi:hypothetical protein